MSVIEQKARFFIVEIYPILGMLIVYFRVFLYYICLYYINGLSLKKGDLRQNVVYV